MFVDVFIFVVFFFKQKTAYEMRISDWSSDVCSSDLDGGSHGNSSHRTTSQCWVRHRFAASRGRSTRRAGRPSRRCRSGRGRCPSRSSGCGPARPHRKRPVPAAGRQRRQVQTSEDRKRVVEGKSGSGRFEFGGGRRIKKKK